MSSPGAIVLDSRERAPTVTEFTRRVKDVIKGGVPPGWVRGEVSNLRVQASGHVYFTLKDAGAQLACVLFRGDAQRQSVRLRDGVQVAAYGEVDVYEARGQYQLITRALLEQGAGRLQEEFERLKLRLAEEGLFAKERKQPLPLLPQTIGFVTSPTGAAVQDFIRILQRRGWRGRLVVLPAKVQGEGAAAEMAAQVRAAEALGIFDLLIVGRGGGSIEDLWAFNEEPLVRAVADCRIPVISAVGHEIDYTLCDFAADVRAETPSGAAELISSQYVDVVGRLERAKESLGEKMGQTLERGRERLDHARSRLRLLSPRSTIERGQQRLDELALRLRTALVTSVRVRREQLIGAGKRLELASPEKRIQAESQRLLALWKRLESASPQAALKRGYAIVRDERGRPVTRVRGLQSGQKLQNTFLDGTVAVKVE